MNTAGNYIVFRRSCTDWKSFAKARRTKIRANVTIQEAMKLCDEFNENRSPSQIRNGTKYEFTHMDNW